MDVVGIWSVELADGVDIGRVDDCDCCRLITCFFLDPLSPPHRRKVWVFVFILNSERFRKDHRVVIKRSEPTIKRHITASIGTVFHRNPSSCSTSRFSLENSHHFHTISAVFWDD